jgi:Nickel responsive protein SCO4226-like
MPSYLMEVYVSKVESAPRAAEDARRVADAAEPDAGELRYVRTLFVAEDETCFHVFEAPSREALVKAARRAGLPDPRVTEAIENEGDEPSQRRWETEPKEEK